MRSHDAAVSGHAADLLGLAEDVARSAGELLLAGWADVADSVSTKSSRTDVVTAMDLASERHIVARIGAARPDDGFLGEEGSDSSGSSGVRWIVDPLDGTVNYLYGLPAWAVSIGVEVDGAVVAGVVHAPVLAKTYTGCAGGPALRNGKQIKTSEVSDPGLALFGTGFAYDAGIRAEQGRILARVIGEIRDIRRYGSAALDLCGVADGTLDAYFERGPKEWDIAAGGFIASLAGAVLSREGDAVAAANPALTAWMHTAGIHPPLY